MLDGSDHKIQIIAGGLNEQAFEWGSWVTNTTGQILPETFAELDIVLANVRFEPPEIFPELNVLLANGGCVSTFRGRKLASIVDLTYFSTSLARDTV